MSEHVSRRTFLMSSGSAAALSGSAFAASDKINLGWIGAGSRGFYLLERLYKGSTPPYQVLAVCDTYAGNLNRGKDRVQTMGGNTPKTFVDYHELLADKDIDAVVIATPEHLHHSMAIAALQAGKHIYLEKPLAKTIEQGAEIVKLAEKSGKIVQVGTQNRSNSLYIKAKDLVAKGMIGDIHYVRAFWYRNGLPAAPVWRYAIPPDTDEKNTDWNKFLGPATRRPFNKQRYFQWRLYWDYSSGISTDLLVHQTDISNFVCGKKTPSSCVASGGIYRWTEDDDREVPDTFSAIYEYPGNFHLNYSCYYGNENYGYGEHFLGNEGTIEVLNRQILTFTPETFKGRGTQPKHIAARQAIREEIPMNDNLAVESHVKNFLDSIRGTARLVAPPPVGQEAAISGHLATMSYRSGKRAFWDDKTQKYRLG